MSTIKESAQEYNPLQVKNITDLDIVDVNLELEEREGIDNSGEKFTYKIVIIDGDEYRVPNKVIGDLKSILEKRADLKQFSVSKTGAGMQTRYTVIPM